ncbi:DinB family protein [Paludisphaera mucosa]|uniref:DinB family protein n=1 Tax=Paludisphaera mucosa TaxID=3030827 RepID=A0ABT6F791_9BACT|nr:DinB family protein [Paludisphaera mucosa]MDG3003429.1 DinB family protein [Paludisphaera mucosa]
MTAKELIRKAFGTSEMILGRYMEGLTDPDLMVRAVPGMNHLAWQIGHLISAERGMVEMIRPGSAPSLPAGFDDTHSRKNTGDDDASKFLSLEAYKTLWKAQRQATLALLDALPDAELDREEPGKFPPFAPSVGLLMHTAGTHPIMHAGQFVAVRRLRGLPIAF